MVSDETDKIGQLHERTESHQMTSWSDYGKQQYFEFANLKTIGDPVAYMNILRSVTGIKNSALKMMVLENLQWKANATIDNIHSIIQQREPTSQFANN